MKLDAFELDRIVGSLEERHNVTLSSGARHSIVTPVLEAQSFGSEVSNAQVEQSIGKIIASAAKYPDPLSGNKRQLTSISVARAIHVNFCNIPPFCSALSGEKE